MKAFYTAVGNTGSVFPSKGNKTFTRGGYKIHEILLISHFVDKILNGSVLSDESLAPRMPAMEDVEPCSVCVIA